MKFGTFGSEEELCAVCLVVVNHQNLRRLADSDRQILDLPTLARVTPLKDNNTHESMAQVESAVKL